MDELTSTQSIQREAIAALLERHNLAALQSIQPLDGTQDGDAFVVNNDLWVRFDRQSPRTSVLQKEAAIYRRLHSATDVPCPEVLALDTTRDLVPYDALILRRVEGVNGAQVWPTLRPEVRESLSEEIGRMIGVVHGLHWDAYGEYDPVTRQWGQASRWVDLLLQRVARVAEQAVQANALPLPIIDAVLTEVNDGDAVLETASPPALVHGDLRAGNLLLQERTGDWHVAALFGWSGASTSDAAWEFSMLSLRGTPQEAVGDAFTYGYRERHRVQNDLRPRMRLYRLVYHLEGALEAATATPPDGARQGRHEVALRRMLVRD